MQKAQGKAASAPPVRPASAPAEGAGRFSPRAIAGPAVIVLIALAAYLPAMRAGFIWDDDSFLTANQLIRAKDGLYRFWFTTDPPDYFPLTSSMLWVEWRLWGMSATGYHVVNVLLHAASAVLLWRVLRRLNVPGAWLAGAIFAVHPVNVESVAWITERKNVLPMAFYLLSILLYLRFDGGGRRRWYWFSLGAFLLGLLSKTSVVMLPVVLLGCAWWRRGRISRRDLLRSVPFFALAAGLAAATIWFQSHRAIQETVIRTDGFASRLATAGWAVWFYLYKAVLPIDLIFVYPRWEVSASSAWSYMPGAILIACFAALWRYRRSWARPVLFALGYFVLTLFPVLGFWNIYFMRYSLVADHWQYVSIVGVIALAAGAGWRFAGRLDAVGRRVAAAAAAVLVGVLGVMTWLQCGMYRDEETLLRRTIALNQGAWMAYHNLGVLQLRQGKAAEAIESFRKTLRMKADHPEAHSDLGAALVTQGQVAEGLEHLHEALRLNPRLAEAHNNLGTVLAGGGNRPEAIRHFRAATQSAPDSVDAFNNLAFALSQEGVTDQAIEYYRRSLEIAPGQVKVLVNLADALIRRGRLDEAAANLQEAIRLDANSELAHHNLGKILSGWGRHAEAIREYREALRLNPNLPEATNNLAWLLAASEDAKLRNPAEAVRLAEELCRATDYRSPMALDTMAAAYAEAGRFPDAVRFAAVALQLAQGAGQQALAAEVQARLRLYQAGKCYREKAAPSPNASP